MPDLNSMSPIDSPSPLPLSRRERGEKTQCLINTFPLPPGEGQGEGINKVTSDRGH